MAIKDITTLDSKVCLIESACFLQSSASSQNTQNTGNGRKEIYALLCASQPHSNDRESFQSVCLYSQDFATKSFSLKVIFSQLASSISSTQK